MGRQRKFGVFFKGQNLGNFVAKDLQDARKKGIQCYQFGRIWGMKMALEKKVIGGRVYAIDRDNKLLFTKGEWDRALKRYTGEFAKEMARQQKAQAQVQQ